MSDFHGIEWGGYWPGDEKKFVLSESKVKQAVKDQRLVSIAPVERDGKMRYCARYLDGSSREYRANEMHLVYGEDPKSAEIPAEPEPICENPIEKDEIVGGEAISETEEEAEPVNDDEARRVDPLLENEDIVDAADIPGFDWVLERENEDAIPFRDSELVVVSDGMGGTGAMEVELPSSDMAGLKKAACSLMYLDKDPKLQEFVDRTFEDIFRLGEGKERFIVSNAALGSRIVCCRFTYIKRHRFLDVTPMMKFNERDFVEDFTADYDFKTAKMLPSLEEGDLNDEEYRRKAMAFLTFGLCAVGRLYHIGPYASSSFAILPATLAAAITHDVEGKKVVDVIWAGDSRVYGFFDKEGIMVINKDDEGKDKRMNNFLCAERLAKLKHIRYEGDLPEKFIVFACSDGIFDAFPKYDATAISAIFSLTLRSLGDNLDYQKWGEAICENYKENYRIDDISISLTAYGYPETAKPSDLGIIDEEREALFAEAHKKRDILDYIGKKVDGKIVEDHYIESRAASQFRSERIERSATRIAEMFVSSMAKPSEEKDIILRGDLDEYLSSFIPPERPNTEKMNALYAEMILDCFEEDPNKVKELIDSEELDRLIANYLQSLDAVRETAKRSSLHVEISEYDDIGDAVSEAKRIVETLEESAGAVEARKADVSAFIDNACANGTLSSMVHEGIKIDHPIEMIPPTLEEIRVAVIEGIKNNPETVRDMVIKAMVAHYDETSAIDDFFNSTSLSSCRQSIALESTWEAEKDFYGRVRVVEEKALTRLASKVSLDD